MQRSICLELAERRLIYRRFGVEGCYMILVDLSGIGDARPYRTTRALHRLEGFTPRLIDFATPAAENIQVCLGVATESAE
jgi:hypothetical protein